LIWALSYNLCAVPAAAMGLIVPWVAALGMSLSSLVVVLNAIRAGRAAKATATNSAKLNLQTFNKETHP
jgi:Cu2+-exporting ATPase